MADISAERGAARAAEVGCPFFIDYHEALIEEGRKAVAAILAIYESARVGRPVPIT